MDTKELKNKILNNTLDDSVLVMKYSDNKFLCNQYINEICKIKNKIKCVIESLDDINNDSDIFGYEDNNLYIYYIKKLEGNVNIKSNLIIVCEEVENCNLDYVDMTKVLNWQIEEFVKMRCSGLNETEIKWLCSITNYDIFRLNNECSKLEIFPPASQRLIFNQINNENGYCDLNNLNIFNFTTALLKKDKETLNNILSNIQYIDIEGTGLVTILINNIKNIINVQFNPKATAEMLGMNPKQYNAVRYSVGKFTSNQLIKMYEFLLGIDYELKTGNLQLDADNRINNAKLVDYITINMFNLMLNN